MKDLYFKNEEAKLIFILVEMYGIVQLELLGIDQSYFTNKIKARNWYQSTKEVLEASEHPNVEKAMKRLERLYKGMK